MNHSNALPKLDGSNYRYWKIQMQCHLEGIDTELWDLVEKGYAAQIGETQAQKDAYRRTNARAKSIIFGALTQDELNRVISLLDAHKIWTALEEVHEGTSSVKDTKLEVVTKQLETFKMTDDESISDMFARLNNLANQLKGLGKQYDNETFVKKFFRSLHPRHYAHGSLVKRTSDLKTMTPHEALGEMIIYEMEQNEFKVPKESTSHKMKNLALKAKHHKKEEVEEKDNSSDDETCSTSSSVDGDGMALLVKGVARYIRRNGYKANPSFRARNKGRKGRKWQDKKTRGCYYCDEPGHFISECPHKKEDEQEEKHKGHKKKSHEEYKKKSYEGERKKFYKKDHKKKGGRAFIGEEFDSGDSSSSSSEDEGKAKHRAHVAIGNLEASPSLTSTSKPSIFDVDHLCLMAKKASKKVTK